MTPHEQYGGMLCLSSTFEDMTTTGLNCIGVNFGWTVPLSISMSSQQPGAECVPVTVTLWTCEVWFKRKRCSRLSCSTQKSNVWGRLHTCLSLSERGLWPTSVKGWLAHCSGDFWGKSASCLRLNINRPRCYGISPSRCYVLVPLLVFGTRRDNKSKHCCKHSHSQKAYYVQTDEFISIWHTE